MRHQTALQFELSPASCAASTLRWLGADGGGIAGNNATSVLALSTVTLRSNTAASGGGLFLNQMPNGTVLSVTGSTITVRLKVLMTSAACRCTQVQHGLTVTDGAAE